jgi:hypothetical protein
VIPVNDEPVLTQSIPDWYITQDILFEFQVPQTFFTDADNETITLTTSLASGESLPVWLSFDATKRMYSGTPLQTDIGSITIKLIATDVSGASASDEFKIHVLGIQGTTNHPPVVSKQSQELHVVEGIAFTHILNDLFTDADGDALIYTMTTANGEDLPSWLSFDNNTLTISGTPDSADDILTLVLTATDPHGLWASIEIILMIDMITGADNPYQESDQIAWPNPSYDYININTGDKPLVLVEIHDMSGRTLTQNLSGRTLNSVKLDIKEYPAGLYILHVITQDSSQQIKVIKK